MTAKILILFIRCYQAVSAFARAAFGVQGSCRFEPSCSHYAVQAIREKGAIHGSALAWRRLLSCRPFGKFGWDPVPQDTFK